MSPTLIDSSWRQSKNRRWGCGGARAKNTDRKGRHPAFQSSDQPGLPTCATKAEIALSLFAGGRNPGPLGTWGILRARNLTWAAKMGFRGLFQKPLQSLPVDCSFKLLPLLLSFSLSAHCWQFELTWHEKHSVYFVLTDRSSPNNCFFPKLFSSSKFPSWSL